MAKRIRRRTRSRNRRRQPEAGFDSQAFGSPFAENQYFSGTLQHVPNASQKLLLSREASAGHWQSQWDAWQTRRLSGSAVPFVSQHRTTASTSSVGSLSSVYSASQFQNATRPSSSSSSEHSFQSSVPAPVRGRPAAEVSVVEHRLRMFGGEVDDGLALCEPMMKVVRRLFDGKLDYLDP